MSAPFPGRPGTLALALGAVGAATDRPAPDAAPAIQGFEPAPAAADASAGWQPVSDRRLRVGIVGYGVCRFGAGFGFQNHPNVEVVAVSDLVSERCAALAKACPGARSCTSLEELLRDDTIEAVFVATDAPSHAQHCIEVMQHGKHVASAVPAVFGSLEDAERLLATVKSTGCTYMLFETSCYHEDCHAMRQIYQAGGFGDLVYAEGEYFHWMPDPIASWGDWRVGLPPQWYPTHSNAYYIGVTGDYFTEVSCLARPSTLPWLQPGSNRYGNPFGTEIAMFRTRDGGMARMGVSWDTPGRGGEMGRIRGQRGSFYGRYEGLETNLPALARPPLPPGVQAGGHGGSHGYLTNEFVNAILENRRPLVDIAWALNLTVPGIVAHESARRDGETLKIPHFAL